MRVAPLVLALLTASAAGAQTFRPAAGPWTRAHELVGSTPDGLIFARVGPRLGVTRDGGRTWTVVSEAVAPTRLVAVGDALLGAFPDGVRVSADGGATWVPDGLAGLAVHDVAADGSRRYALTSGTLYTSGGAGWQPVPTRPDGSAGAVLARVDASGGTIAVGGFEQQCTGIYGQAVFYRSRDGGATWTRTAGSGAISDVAVAADGTAYFATSDGQGCLNQSTPGGLFAQEPDAATAVLRSSGDTGGVAIDAAGQPITSVPFSTDDVRIDGVAVAGGSTVVGTRPQQACGIDPPCFYLSSSGLYARRGDAAEPVGFVRSAVRALGTVVAAPDGAVPIVAADGAVFGLRSGALIFEAPLGGVRAFVPAPGTPEATLALSAGADDLFGSGRPSASGLPLAIPLGAVAPGYYTMLSSFATVSATVSGDRLVTASSRFYDRPGLYVTTGTDDPRRTLEAGDLGSVGALEGTTVVYVGAVDDLWAFPPSGPPSARIFRSDDRGETWTPDAAGMTARNVYAFEAIGTGASRLDVAGTSGGVFARTPSQPWQVDGLADRTVYTLYTAPVGLLAGTDDGLFLRDAAGAWTRYGAGLDGRTVYAVLATDDAFGPWLGVGTDAGLFQTRPFGVASEAPAGPAAARLAVTTVPNPARGLRTVRVVGLADDAASVSVFDLLGRRVADLGAHEARPGERLDVPWDASALPAGVYVVRVRSGSGVATARAVVTR